MRCDECLAVIEDYTYGELDEQTADHVAAHTAACAACACACEALSREQAIYSLYERDIEVTPALWNIVRARINEEKIAPRPGPLSRLRESLIAAGAIFALPRLTPALAAVLALFVIGITAGVVKYRSQRNSETETPIVAHNENESSTDEKAVREINGATDRIEEESAVKAALQSSDVPDNQQMTAAVATVNKEKIKRVKRKGNAYAAPPNTSTRDDGTEPFDAASVDAGVHSALTDHNEAEIASHIEKAQILLRSFRNVRFAEDETPIGDIAYEKRLSRTLLNDNIVLRRDAETEGNLPAEEVLGSLEPFLLDIANLQDNPSRDAVRMIKQRMEKKEIIASLQVH